MSMYVIRTRSASDGSSVVRSLPLPALIAARPPLAVRAARRAIARVRDLAPAEALAEEHEHVRRLLRSRDHQAAVAASVARRAPVFTGE